MRLCVDDPDFRLLPMCDRLELMQDEEEVIDLTDVALAKQDERREIRRAKRDGEYGVVDFIANLPVSRPRNSAHSNVVVATNFVQSNDEPMVFVCEAIGSNGRKCLGDVTDGVCANCGAQGRFDDAPGVYSESE